MSYYSLVISLAAGALVEYFKDPTTTTIDGLITEYGTYFQELGNTNYQQKVAHAIDKMTLKRGSDIANLVHNAITAGDYEPYQNIQIKEYKYQYDITPFKVAMVGIAAVAAELAYTYRSEIYEQLADYGKYLASSFESYMTPENNYKNEHKTSYTYSKETKEEYSFAFSEHGKIGKTSFTYSSKTTFSKVTQVFEHIDTLEEFTGNFEDLVNTMQDNAFDLFDAMSSHTTTSGTIHEYF